MTRMGFSVQLHYDVTPPGADFIFNVQAARTRHQRVLTERLEIDQPVLLRAHDDVPSRTRYLRVHALPGPLTLRYQATVDLDHYIAAPESLAEVPVDQVPGHVLPFLYPSRFCESDLLSGVAQANFGTLWQGYARVIAIRDWVHDHVAFRANSSDSTTSARDTLARGAGVCRDFAHLMIALCRALNIPARFTTGFDYGADPALGPPDFHAYVEAFVGHRWYIFDPSRTAIPMAFVRLATGRDAAEAAFATIFGKVDCMAPLVQIQALPDDFGRLSLPQHTASALSTDSGEP